MLDVHNTHECSWNCFTKYRVCLPFGICHDSWNVDILDAMVLWKTSWLYSLSHEFCCKWNATAGNPLESNILHFTFLFVWHFKNWKIALGFGEGESSLPLLKKQERIKFPSETVQSYKSRHSKDSGITYCCWKGIYDITSCLNWRKEPFFLFSCDGLLTTTDQ